MPLIVPLFVIAPPAVHVAGDEAALVERDRPERRADVALDGSAAESAMTPLLKRLAALPVFAGPYGPAAESKLSTSVLAAERHAVEPDDARQQRS